MKIALVGCGAVAGRWVRNIIGRQDLTLKSLVDVDRQACENLKAGFGLDVSCHGSLDVAFRHHQLDAVVNLTPPGHHARVTEAALSRGAHVLSEKPLAVSYADARALAQLAEAQSLILAVMRNRGQHPNWLRVCEIARRGRAGGDLLSADVRLQVPLRRPGFRGAGPQVATEDLAIHIADQALGLMSAGPCQVWAHENALPVLGLHCSVLQGGILFDDDSLLTFRAGFVPVDAPRTNANGIWQIDSPARSVSWDGNRHVTTYQAGRSPETLELPETASSFDDSVKALLDGLVAGLQSRVALRASVASVALVDAMCSSISLSGKSVVPISSSGEL